MVTRERIAWIPLLNVSVVPWLAIFGFQYLLDRSLWQFTERLLSTDFVTSLVRQGGDLVLG